MITEFLKYVRSFRLNRESFLLIAWLTIAGLASNWLYFCFQQFKIGELYCFSFSADYDILPLSPIAVKIILWVIIYLSFRLFWSVIKNYNSRVLNNSYSFDFQNKDKELTLDRFRKEWIFQGNVFPTGEGLLISNTNSGCLVKSRWYRFDRIWKDFTVDLGVKFSSQEQENPINPIEGFVQDPDVKDRYIKAVTQNKFRDYFGVVFRAQNLADYLMMEFQLVNGYLVLRPHIRLGGDWDAIDLNVDENSLEVGKERSFNIKVVVKDEIVSIDVNGIKKALSWVIPSHVEPRLKQHDGESKDKVSTLIPKLYLRNRAGMFGFRCYGNQIVLIKSIDIRNN